MGGVEIVYSLLKVLAVFALLYVTLRALAKHQHRRPGSKSTPKNVKGRMVEVLDQSRLGRSSNVVVVRAGDRVFLLGVTDSEITVLADVSDDVEVASYEEPEDQERVLDHALDLLRSGSFRPGK